MLATGRGATPARKVGGSTAVATTSDSPNADALDLRYCVSAQLLATHHFSPAPSELANGSPPVEMAPFGRAPTYGLSMS